MNGELMQKSNSLAVACSARNEESVLDLGKGEMEDQGTMGALTKAVLNFW